ncbi:MAG TPA: XRE family transcriptional regulator [Burkholderiales bacterium]|nr:XRE family transcriptional regulator [Burkholderiales bacterium]
MGFPESEAQNLALRSDLMIRIEKLVRDSGMTQQQAAKTLGVTQPRLNALLKGKIADFTLHPSPFTHSPFTPSLLFAPSPFTLHAFTAFRPFPLHPSRLHCFSALHSCAAEASAGGDDEIRWHSMACPSRTASRRFTTTPAGDERAEDFGPSA